MPPRFPPKPPAPSIHSTLGPAIGRARRLKPDQKPRSQSEVIDEIERTLDLPPGLVELMRQQAARDDKAE